MKNKIAFIIPYFGKLPNFARFFFESTKHNLDFDFIFFTDIDTILETENVFVNKMQSSEFKQLASEKMGLNISFTYAYKLCEFKPVYGKIFEDYIQQYTFWGVCDIDLILGKLTHFITDDLLEKIDIYSGVSHYLSGSFFLFRNVPSLNSLYENSTDYKQIFENEEYRFFDECGPVWHELAQGRSLDEVDAGIDSITHVIKRQEKEGKLKTYFTDSILERTGNNQVLVQNGVIVLSGKEYLTLHFIYLKTTYHFFVPNWNPIPLNYFVDRLGFHPMSSLNGFRYVIDGAVANKVRNKFDNIMKRIVKLDFVPSSDKKVMEIKKQFNHNLEALRGFAALSVFLFHLIIYPEFNTGYKFRDDFFPYSPPGHFVVMIFFMLSGYVIGLTNKESASFSIRQYLKKRFVRLCPIYLVAIAITVFLFCEKTSVVIGNVFFVQNLLCDNLVHNQALWSLNHEMIYYILAIPVLFFNWRSEWVIYFCLFLLAISLFFYSFPVFVEAYLVGFSFWLLGFLISKQKIEWVASPNQLLSVLILLLGCDYLNLTSALLSRIPMQHGEGMYLQGIVSVSDFGLLPACVYAICTFTGVSQKMTKYIFYVVYASSLLHLSYLLYSGSFFKTQVFILPTVFVLVSLLVYYWKSLPFKMDKLAWLGSISYAVYVIHTPILYAFGKIPFCGGNLFSFFVRLAVIVPLVILFAHLLEKKMQPWVRAKLY